MTLVSELPTEFTKPLTDTTITEKESVVLECEVSKPNKPARWYKDGKELKQSDNIKFTSFENTHRMIVKSATLDDEAEYTVEIDGQKSPAHLYVEGKFVGDLGLYDHKN